MPGPFDNLGAEFANFAAFVNGDQDATVTIERVDPDSDEVLATADNVVALKLTSTGASAKIGGGGAIGMTSCEFWLTGFQVGFEPAEHDRIVEPNGGPTWLVNSCERIGYGEEGTLYHCPVTLAREDIEATE